MRRIRSEGEKGRIGCVCCCLWNLGLGADLEIPEGRVSLDLGLEWLDFAEADLGRRLFLPIFERGRGQLVR
jgi:hypothetical protein